MKVIKVGWCAEKFHQYVVFHRSILFILGLIFGLKLVDQLFFCILVTYLIPPTMVYNLQTVAVLVNLVGGISSVSAIFMALVADAYVGLFKMLISASALCVAGLVLTHYAATKTVDYDIALQEMFYAALLLLTVSDAAKMGTLNLFLGDQLATDRIRDQPPTPEKDRSGTSEHRIKFWLCFVSVFASIFSLFGPLKNSRLIDLVKVLAIVMGATFFCFLLGFKFYNLVEPTRSALRDVPVVVYDALVKRNIAYPQSSEQQLISPHDISWLRWLDRAALVQENRLGGRICSSVEQVKGVKSFLKMLPMWSSFVTFSFVAACGDTFFLQEAYSFEFDDIFPLIFLIQVWAFTAVVVALISPLVFKTHKMMLVRIGLGMACCVLCCLAAWTQTLHRLSVLNTFGRDQGFRLKDYMSVYRLTPQFLLLGFMQGFSLEGLQAFFESQVPRSMHRYGPSLGKFVMGFGKFVSIAFILILNKCFAWFGDDVETSRLDDIYVFLGGLSCANLIIYCFVARWYQDKYSSTDSSSSSTC